jgi:hypothetical protein
MPVRCFLLRRLTEFVRYVFCQGFLLDGCVVRGLVRFRSDFFGCLAAEFRASICSAAIVSGEGGDAE